MIKKSDSDKVFKILKDKCSKYENINPHYISIDNKEIIVSITITDGNNEYPFVYDSKNYKYTTVNSLSINVFKSLKELMKFSNVKLIKILQQHSNSAVRVFVL